MAKVKITSKKAMPRTVYFHSFIKTKNTLDVLLVRFGERIKTLEQITIVQQKLIQKEIWLNGLVAINFANMMQNVSLIFFTIFMVPPGKNTPAPYHTFI